MARVDFESEEDLVQPLTTVLRPILKSMELLGFVQGKSLMKKMTCPGGEDTPSKRRKLRCFWLYSMTLYFLDWANLLRFCLGFWVSGVASKEVTVVLVSWVVWTLQSCLYRTIFFRLERAGHLRTFHSLWSELCTASQEMSEPPVAVVQSRRWRRRVCGASLIAWGFILCSWSLQTVVTFSAPPNASIESDAALCSPFYPTIPMKVLFYLTTSPSFMTCEFPVWVIFIYTTVLADQFNNITKQLKEAIASAGNKFPPRLDTFRQKHLQTCRWLEVLEKEFRLLVMALYVFTIPMACVEVYIAANGGVYQDQLIWTLYWSFTYVRLLALATMACARVNSAAHAPLELLHEVHVENATKTQLAQLNLFISRLSNTSIGFTALGLVTITKEVLLTIGGLYMTYVFLVLQFKVN